MTNADINLISSQRCALFKSIAESVWQRIIRKHNLGIDDKEVAITNDILADILEYHQSSPLNFDVFARDGYLEKKYGRDIEIFIEVAPNKYRWFAFQAKLLKKENAYTGLRHTSSKKNGVKQWLKLKRLERASRGGCKANYLLYNGKHDFSIRRQSDCNPLVFHREEQYGCSIVDIETIKRVATTKVPGKRKKWVFSDPTFEDLHPHHATPWKDLVCCWLDNDPFENILYSYADILDSANQHDRIVIRGETNNNIENNSSDKDKPKQREGEFINKNNPITRASIAAKWEPGIKLIISTTT